MSVKLGTYIDVIISPMDVSAKPVNIFLKSDQCKHFVDGIGKSRDEWGTLRYSFCVVRTDNLKSFFRDLLSPNTQNTEKGKALAIFTDIVTFPIRLITLPFRLFFMLFFMTPHSFLNQLPKAQQKQVAKWGKVKIEFNATVDNLSLENRLINIDQKQHSIAVNLLPIRKNGYKRESITSTQAELMSQINNVRA